MGKSYRTKRDRGKLEFPHSVLEAIDLIGSDRPKRRRKAIPKLPAAKHTKLPQFGQTPEERLQSKSPMTQRLSGPERMVWGWLVRNNIPFDSQVEVLGGRRPGGAVIDFIIAIRQPPIALRIQGYWHDNVSAKLNDDQQQQALEELGYSVIDIWEHELATVDMTHWTMINALYGRAKPSGSMGGAAPGRRCPYCGRIDCFECVAGMW